MGDAYRDGRIHVCAEECDTCVFRPANLMHLAVGRLADIVRQNVDQDTALTCHSTLDGPNAVCRGFFDRHKTPPLQLAERMDLVTYIDPPSWP